MITRDSLEKISEGPVNLIYNAEGKVIGNSQELALSAMVLADSIAEFAEAMDKAADAMADKLENFLKSQK